MKIGINAMQVRAAKSGVGQYISGILDGLSLVAHSDDRFTVYCTQENESNYQLSDDRFKTRVWGLPEGKRTKRLLYEYALFHNEIESTRFDVFHGPSNFLPVRKVCPYIVTIHDLSYFVQPERCPFVRRQYWYAMTRRSVTVADRILTSSENSRRDIERFFPTAAGKIVIIPLGVHPRFHPVAYPREQSLVHKRNITRPYVLSVSTLEPGKNIVRTIRAFDRIAPSFPDHLLIIVGDKGWMYEKIYQAAQEATHRDRIHFAGHLDDNEVVDFLNFSEVLVFPSLYEGFGLPPLEAMACGVPVLTSNTSSIPEVVGDAAVTVDPMSEKELADAMQRILSDSSLRKDLGRRGVERAKLYSWNRTAEMTLKVYRELSGQGMSDNLSIPGRQ